MKYLVYVELKNGRPSGAALELVSAAKKAGADAAAVLAENGCEDAAAEAAKFASEVIILDGAALDPNGRPTEDYLTAALAKLASDEGADGVLLSATPFNRNIAPRIASRMGAGCITDVIGLSAEDGSLIFTRPSYGGTVLEKQSVIGGKVVATVRSGSFDAPEEGAAAQPVHKTIAVDDADLRAKITEFIAEAGEVVNLEDADVIVSGGRGMGSEEGFKLVEELANELGGVVGASRPAIENGWIGRTHQVGQSGKIVTPKLYIACGISGAMQHVSGMMDSGYIVAINKDEDAPIFQIADVGIVGDVHKILPLMIDAVKAHKAQ
jgi:electron transfer flavoprotein alpha subunit